MRNGTDAPWKQEKTFAEFFAGIGLIGEGLHRSGWERTYANDFCPRKRALFAQRNGMAAEYDVRDVWDTDDVLAHMQRRPTLATASFPCIDLSVAGHYRGLEGAHSSTFFGFANVLRAMGNDRPRLVLLENVRGFLTARGGRDFRTAIRTLSELGYWVDAFLVDARHFVPQSRPRIFVVGCDEPFACRGSEPGLFGESPSMPVVSLARPRKLLDLVRSTKLATGWCHLDLPAFPECPCELVDVLDDNDTLPWWGRVEIDRHVAMLSDLHRGRLETIRRAGETWIGTGFRRIRHGEQRLEVRFDGVAGCLRTPTGGSAKQIVVASSKGRLRMRWMSPDEYARLQGVDIDGMTGPGNLLLKAFADAVCVPAIEWLDAHVLTPLFETTVASTPQTVH